MRVSDPVSEMKGERESDDRPCRFTRPTHRLIWHIEATLPFWATCLWALTLLSHTHTHTHTQQPPPLVSALRSDRDADRWMEFVCHIEWGVSCQISLPQAAIRSTLAVKSLDTRYWICWSYKPFSLKAMLEVNLEIVCLWISKLHFYLKTSMSRVSGATIKMKKLKYYIFLLIWGKVMVGEWYMDSKLHEHQLHISNSQSVNFARIFLHKHLWSLRANVERVITMAILWILHSF